MHGSQSGECVRARRGGGGGGGGEGDVRMRVCMQCVSYQCVCPGGVTVCVNVC